MKQKQKRKKEKERKGKERIGKMWLNKCRTERERRVGESSKNAEIYYTKEENVFTCV